MRRVITEQELINKFKTFALEMFGWEMNLPVIVSSNKNVKKNYAFYGYGVIEETYKPSRFVVREGLVNGDYDEADVDYVVKHELVHWYTDVTENKPCCHNKLFKENCRKFGIRDTTYIYILKANEWHVLRCGKCNKPVAKSKCFNKINELTATNCPFCNAKLKTARFLEETTSSARIID